MDRNESRRHVVGLELLKTWQDLPLDPVAQLKAVRSYAIQVLGNELSASAWLGQANPAVLDGSCVVSQACETRPGFEAAMLELIRISFSDRVSIGDALRASPPDAP